MKKTVTLALLLAASLGLAACDKKEEDKAAAPASSGYRDPAERSGYSPCRAQRPGAVERHSGNPADSGTDSGATATEPAISSR